jgi:antitoxin (DNA-binding transcriptional repressor) of toxin-antitoxin stability system
MNAPEEIPSSMATRAPAKIFERVFRGETIILTRYGRPYVVLSPPPSHADMEEAKKPATTG